MMYLTLSQNPLGRALAYKDEGNKYFKSGKYAGAIKCYDNAIEICPKDNKFDLSTFYQNRAAAYEQMVGINSHYFE
jgi:import receptor subunit TOM70